MNPHSNKEWEEMYRAYFSDVYLYLISLCRDESLAEDLTHEVFVKAIRSVSKFRGECNIRVWLCQIAKNSYLSYCRKHGREVPTDFDMPAEEESHAGTVRFEERLEDSETAFDLHKVLHMLEEPYKEVFWLRTFGELSFQKIAALFGHSESWARVTYHRARLKIIERWKGKDHHESDQL